MNELFRQAAMARAAAMSQRSHRPQQRRWSQDEAGIGVNRVSCRSRIEVRGSADGGPLEFAGYASVYEAPYEMWDLFGPYTEVVSAGAGAVSLNRADLDVPLVLAHDSLRRIARTTNGTLTLADTDDGLFVHAPALDPNDADVAYIAPKLRAGLIDEMSFMFRIEQGLWSPDYTEYRIERYEIHRGDVAIVGYGANPATIGVLVEQDRSAELDRSRARLTLALTR